ncbi:DUF6088 family protein [Butyrivibrio sp. XBB1001]|uniref:DUF6088 family protein n=1 Tax=Butyrivibrio sp. XBB1001 TaxID=1280682 RepID=UPI00041172B1|nr:DUF6088 family protein [Butyrivibrio sp. XBB1001]
MREKYQIEIEKRIEDADSGYAFSAIDFADIAGTDPTNKALSRLGEAGTIRRVIKGIYDKPLYSKLLGEYSSPNIEKVAQALARKYNWTIAPSGETALNFLHLSTQVPVNYSYVSDGPYRKYKIGNYLVEFKHCANKEISGKSYITIIVIQAIKSIGKDRIQPKDISILSDLLPEEEKKKILREAMTTTPWIYGVIKEVCKK